MMTSTLRFLQHYFRPTGSAVRVRETTYARGGERLPATVYRPARAGDRALPGWVLLHGLTCPGREHASLKRFARAVAASGTVVFVPDIPEWRELRVAPSAAVPTIRAAVLALDERTDTQPGRVGVIGFSFGATQALIAAADPGLEGRLGGVVSWGGYGDPRRLFRYSLTGEHHVDGKVYYADPDPYGRWIMAANYLPHTPGHESDRDVAEALHKLALECGRRGIPSGSPACDPIRDRIRDEVAPQRRSLFDLLAPRSRDARKGAEQRGELARGISDAAIRVDPLIDPGESLPRIHVRTLVAHGRDDRLVPFTEGIRLARALPGDSCVGCTITALFAHSGGTSPELGAFGLTREAARFVQVLGRILKLV